MKEIEVEEVVWITKFKAKDGTLFDRKYDAENYEKQLDYNEKLEYIKKKMEADPDYNNKAINLFKFITNPIRTDLVDSVIAFITKTWNAEVLEDPDLDRYCVYKRDSAPGFSKIWTFKNKFEAEDHLNGRRPDQNRNISIYDLIDGIQLPYSVKYTIGDKK